MDLASFDDLLDREISNLGACGVEQEIREPSYDSAREMQRILGDRPGAAQVRIG